MRAGALVYLEGFYRFDGCLRHKDELGACVLVLNVVHIFFQQDVAAVFGEREDEVAANTLQEFPCSVKDAPLLVDFFEIEFRPVHGEAKVRHLVQKARVHMGSFIRAVQQELGRDWVPL